MKKSGASSPMLLSLWLLAAVIGLFAFLSVDAQSSTSELGNLLLPSESIDQHEDEVAGGTIRCCNRCDICNMMLPSKCRCVDPDRKFVWVPESACGPRCVDNILVTGQTLGPGDNLKYSTTFLEMQKDCDLVLFDSYPSRNVLFSTKTAGKGTNCTLSFMDDGRLAVNDFFTNGGSKTLWKSPNHSNYRPKGRYAAILRPSLEFGIYGPIIWKRPVSPRPNNIREGELSAAFALQNVGWPLLNNVLFSGQSLKDGEALRIPNFRFELNKCNLALIFTIRGITNWESNTTSSTRSCVARLSGYGQLYVVNDLGVTVWSSFHVPFPHEEEGDYALVLEGGGDFGNIAIYGRKSWSTAEDQAE